MHFLSLKVSSHQVTFLADKFATDTTRFYLAYVKPRHNKSIIVNVDDFKDMSRLNNHRQEDTRTHQERYPTSKDKGEATMRWQEGGNHNKIKSHNR